MTYSYSELQPNTAHFHIFNRDWGDGEITGLMEATVRTCEKTNCVEVSHDGSAYPDREWIVWRDPAVRHLMRITRATRTGRKTSHSG